MNTIRQTFENYINSADSLLHGRQMQEILSTMKNRSSYTEQLRDPHGLVMLTAWSTAPNGRRCFLFGHAMNEQCFYQESTFQDGSLCKLHGHRNIELLYVVHGRLKIRIEEKDVIIKEGEQLLINADVIHGEYLFTEECLLLCLGIDDSYFAQESDIHTALGGLIARKKSDYMYMRFTPIANAHETRMAYEILLNEILHSRPGKKNLMIGYAKRIVDLLRTEFQVQVTKELKEDFQNALTEDIRLYIKEHYADVTVNQIGEEYHYSPDYLSRLFRRQRGKSLSAYIQDIRLREAAKLLETTNTPIDEIAVLVGYHNLGFFYQLFKKQYGILPAEYRTNSK